MHEKADFQINHVSTAYAHYALSILFFPLLDGVSAPSPHLCTGYSRVQILYHC